MDDARGVRRLQPAARLDEEANGDLGIERTEAPEHHRQIVTHEERHDEVRSVRRGVDAVIDDRYDVRALQLSEHARFAKEARALLRVEPATRRRQRFDREALGAARVDALGLEHRAHSARPDDAQEPVALADARARRKAGGGGLVVHAKGPA